MMDEPVHPAGDANVVRDIATAFNVVDVDRFLAFSDGLDDERDMGNDLARQHRWQARVQARYVLQQRRPNRHKR